jgi:hypothetical protein
MVTLDNNDVKNAVSQFVRLTMLKLWAKKTKKRL